MRTLILFVPQDAPLAKARSPVKGVSIFCTPALFAAVRFLTFTDFWHLYFACFPKLAAIS